MKNEQLVEDSELHRHVLAWLSANGIDPGNIPVSPTMTLDGDKLTTDVYMLGENGKRLMSPGLMDMQRTVATYTVSPPPPDVAEWLRSRCPTCGR